MRKGLRLGLILFVFFCGLQPGNQSFATGQSSSNGVYGGYVGSSAWFSSMRRAAANQAMLATLGHSTNGSGEIPPGYIEFAGQITLPAGNPFPGHRLPDLRIKCRDTSADSVERAPFLSQDGSFYTIFKKGQTYDLYWMYYFGSKEKFGALSIADNATRQVMAVIEYRYQQPTRITSRTSGSSAVPAAEANEQSLSAGPRGNSGRVLTAKDLLGLLQGDVPQIRIESLVHEYGVDFNCTAEIEEQLRDAGAKDSLLSTIRQSAPTGPAVSAASGVLQNLRTAAGDDVVSTPQAPAETASRPPRDADRFDLSGLPKEPTTFEEQQIFQAVRTARSAALKAFAHAKLARYYEKKGDSLRAQEENAKAEYWNNHN